MVLYLRFLVGRLAPYKKKVSFLAFLALAAAALETTAPLLLGRALDRAIAKDAILVWAFFLLAWYAARFVAERCRTYIASQGTMIGNRIGTRILLDSIGELLLKPLPFHYDSKSHEVNETLSKFRWEFSNFMQGGVFDLVPALLTGFAIMIYIAFVDIRISGVLFFFMSLFLWYSYRTSRTWQNYRDKWHEMNKKATTPGWDALKNILIIKSTTNEEFVKAKLSAGEASMGTTDVEYNSFDREMQNKQNLIVGIGTLVVLGISISNLASGRFSFGTVTAMNSYALIVLGYVRYVQWTFRSLGEGSTLFAKAQKLLALPPENYASGQTVALSGAVTFDHIAFRYLDKKPVLTDVSFKVEVGQRVAIVGESGEGKTTIIDLLGRYYLPREGKILFDGVDSGLVNLESLRSQMAYVPQDLSLLHESLGENIRFGRQSATQAEVVEAAQKAHLHEFIIGLPKQYETLVGERGLKLSGGQRQRVALARAFLRHPKILILDEPTSNLDSKTEAGIQESLAELMKGKTTFIIAHRLRTIQEADIILFLKDGKIAESGTHAELIKKKGAYAELVRVQQERL